MAAIARARGWLYDIFAHNHAESLRTKRMVERKAMGVPLDDLPYPGHHITNITTTSTRTSSPPAAATPFSTAAAAESVTPAASSPPHYVAVYEQQKPDGSWQELKREPLQ